MGLGVYRVFEALDELVAIVEEARSVPMTASCVVPRGDVLELLDDVRDASPGELDDAQDVLDHRDKLVGDARQSSEQMVTTANAQAHQTITEAREDADRILADAKAQAASIVSEAETRGREEVARLERERTSLEGRISELRNFERDYRAQLRSYIEGKLRDLETTATTSGAQPVSAVGL